MKRCLLKSWICVLLLGLMSFCSHEVNQGSNPSQPTRETPLELRFVEAQKVLRQREITAVGTLDAAETVTVSTEVAGRVEKVYADVGDFVDAGRVLLEIDKRELQIQRDRSQAALDEVLARFGATDPLHLPAAVEVSEVRQAAALFEDAQRKLKRSEELFSRGVVSEAQLDDARTTVEVAETRYQATADQVQNELVSVRGYRADLALAVKKLEDATLRARLSAFVQQRHVSPGEYVKESTPAFTLVQAQALKLISDLPEREAAALKVGLPVKFSVDAFPGLEFDARITRITPAVDEKTRTFQIEAMVSVPKSEGYRLRPGFFARTRILAEAVEITLIPVDALYVLSGVKKVFVGHGDRVEEREVVTGQEEGDRIEIVRGVKPGEMVAVNRLADLTDGQQVVRVSAESAN